ncbi:hypothetical protein ESCO3_00015 [Escherichia phage vB_EcoS_ESCO3]|nr:hypothetical protein ESCO3_00015 [Escherichia phage vB_EcoS_ESCO3]
MAGLGMQFNAGQHAERQHNSLMPAGWYVVQIVNSEIKPTKTPGGARLNLQFKIMQGDFAGRVMFGGYNVKNANPVAVQIAMEELAELSRAVKVPVWNDTEQLHGIPFNLKVKVRQQPGYEPNNEPQIYQAIDNMEGVVYATKADMANLPKSTPAAAAQSPAFGGGAFGGAQQQQQQPQQGFPGAFGQQPQQPQQQPQTQGFQQPQQQQQPQQPVQQQQQSGTVDFNSAAQSQPWATGAQQPQQTQQPNWATQQVQPGAEQPQTQAQNTGTANHAEPEVQDDIAKAAQTKTPPWKRSTEGDDAAQ